MATKSKGHWGKKGGGVESIDLRRLFEEGRQTIRKFERGSEHSDRMQSAVDTIMTALNRQDDELFEASQLIDDLLTVIDDLEAKVKQLTRKSKPTNEHDPVVKKMLGRVEHALSKVK